VEKSTSEPPSVTFEEDVSLDSVLDPAIIPAHPVDNDTVSEPGSVRESHFILCTGVTGFVGAFILYELLQQTKAQVICIVRSSSSQEAIGKLINHMKEYQIWKEEYLDRVDVVVGDLTNCKFGLTDEEFENLANKVDTVYPNELRLSP
jgi:hypothetical protein